MYSVQRSALVMHSAEKMFRLVNDVDRYHEFLPWCGDSKVVEQNHGEVIASVTIDFKGVKKSFTTKNELIEFSRTNLSLVDGPFSQLSGYWEFTELEANSSKVVLNLNFDFSNRIVGKIVGPVFSTIADSMVDSFSKRANEIYHGGDR